MSLVRVHALVAWLFVATIVIQVFLAGAAIANLGGTGAFGTHIEFGYTWIGIAVLVLLVTAFLARRPRREMGYVAAILVLYIVQTMLPLAKESIPAIAALHPVNALFLFGVAAWYARRAWGASAA
jgi:hypothetical protein